jgi:hypothetical protein
MISYKLLKHKKEIKLYDAIIQEKGAKKVA